MKRFRFLFAPEGDPPAGGGEAATDVKPAPAAPVPAAPAAPAPAAPTVFNPDGSFGADWHVALGDEFSAHAATLGNFKNVGGLAKSYLHLQRHGPAYPEDGATPEDVTRFHALAKVPAEGTAMGYGLAIPETASDADKAVFSKIAEVAHKNHVPAPGLKALVETFQSMQVEQVQAFEAEIANQRKAAEDSLVAEWRGNFEANKSTVRHLAGKLAEQAGVNPQSPSFAEMVNNPEFARIVLQVSKLTSEDRLRAPANFGDLRSAQQRVDGIMDGTDPVWGKKYTAGTKAEREAAYNEVSRLLQEAAK